MRKNTLIRVLSLIVAMTCVVVMLCTCSKDKDKKEKEKSEKSEPKSKYAMDVGEFEGKEGEDYTNQVFLFSGIVEKFHASDSDVYGVTFILKSEDKNVNDERSFTIRNVLEDADIEAMEQAAANESKVYILATSVWSGENEKDSAAIVSGVEEKYRIYGRKSKVFYSDINSVDEVDKAYEDEVSRIDEMINKTYDVGEIVNGMVDGSVNFNDFENIYVNAEFNTEFLKDYDKGLFISSDFSNYKKTYTTSLNSIDVDVTIYKNDKFDINNVKSEKNVYLVKMRILENSITIVEILN